MRRIRKERKQMELKRYPNYQYHQYHQKTTDSGDGETEGTTKRTGERKEEEGTGVAEREEEGEELGVLSADQREVQEEGTGGGGI